MPGPGLWRCEVSKFEESLCSSRAAMTVTAEERAIPVSEERKIKLKKK